jgi:hypothetical protein
MTVIPFTFDESSHIYTVKSRGISREVPGCTRVIDSSGMVDYGFVRPDILERKSILGREVHRVTKLYDLKRLDFTSIDARVIPYLDSWIMFRKITGFVPEFVEEQCIAEADGMLYGMQIDAAGHSGIGGRRSIETIVEKKCTVTVMPHHYVQTAGYALGWPKRIGRVEIVSPMARFLGRRRTIAQLTPRGIPNIFQCTDNEDAGAFLKALWISEWKRRHQEIYREAA